MELVVGIEPRACSLRVISPPFHHVPRYHKNCCTTTVFSPFRCKAKHKITPVYTEMDTKRAGRSRLKTKARQADHSPSWRLFSSLHSPQKPHRMNHMISHSVQVTQMSRELFMWDRMCATVPHYRDRYPRQRRGSCCRCVHACVDELPRSR